MGPPTSAIARITANSGRANSVDPDTAGVLRSEVITLLTLMVSPPRKLNLYLDSLNSVKRSPHGICFTKFGYFAAPMDGINLQPLRLGTRENVVRNCWMHQKNGYVALAGRKAV